MLSQGARDIWGLGSPTLEESARRYHEPSCSRQIERVQGWVFAGSRFVACYSDVGVFILVFLILRKRPKKGGTKGGLRAWGRWACCRRAGPSRVNSSQLRLDPDFAALRILAWILTKVPPLVAASKGWGGVGTF